MSETTHTLTKRERAVTDPLLRRALDGQRADTQLRAILAMIAEQRGLEPGEVALSRDGAHLIPKEVPDAEAD